VLSLPSPEWTKLMIGPPFKTDSTPRQYCAFTPFKGFLSLLVPGSISPLADPTIMQGLLAVVSSSQDLMLTGLDVNRVSSYALCERSPSA